MGSLADITLGDIGRALGRYRPVVVTVAIILVVVAILPGPRRAALDALPSGVAVPADAADAEATVADEATSDTVPPSADFSTFDSSTSSSGPTSTFSSSDSSFDSSSSAGETSSSEFSSDFSSSDFGSDFSTTTTTTSTPARPLTIVEAGWASATGSTPIGSTGVPGKALPVGKRIGQVDKYSFVRLQGDQKVLTLRVNAEPGRTTTGVVAVSICQITDAGWQAADNVPSDRAPKYDTATCVPGDPGDGKTWTFNLLTFASPTDARGFALVPTGDSIDYQVNFDRT